MFLRLNLKITYMKKFGILLLLVLPAIFAFSQKQISDANAVKRNVSSFHGVDVASGIDLILTQGTTEAVAVSASDPKYTENIITEVKGGILKIYLDMDSPRDWFRNNSNKKLKAYVSIKNIDVLHASSGAQVNVDGSINSSKLDMDISSGAMIKGKFYVQSLDVDQSSGSIARITGNVGQLKVEGSSGSIFDGYELQAENCDAGTSSGSIVRITVNKELSVAASSGGNISYKGNASIKNIQTSSGGNVSKKS